MTDSLPAVTRLEIVPLRSAFQREAHEFTTWLETHIEALAERLGLELTVVQREKRVGDFNLDLLCSDSSGRPVIVENQLERTDHDHLGKLLTYLVNLDASAAVWLTPDPRAEHQRVVEWLNESTPTNVAFYLVKVEAVRIGTSPFAPLFTVLAGPDEQAKEIGEKKKEWADREHRHLEFWKSLLDRSKSKTRLFSTITPGPANWIASGLGRSGVRLTYVIAKNWAASEVYIDTDRDTGSGNKAIFDALQKEKDAIEREIGTALEWERLDDRRASRIRKKFSGADISSPASWPTLQDQMIEVMILLDKAFRPRLARIDL